MADLGVEVKFNLQIKIPNNADLDEDEVLEAVRDHIDDHLDGSEVDVGDATVELVVTGLTMEELVK